MREHIVLVHGLWMTGASMWPLAVRLRRAGYDCSLPSYHSVSRGLRENAERLARHCAGLNAETVHFVGHSLGGLVVLALLHFFPGQRPGRIVTMGTPHCGSAAARALAARGWPRPLLGRGVAEVAEGRHLGWGMPARAIGVIAGNHALGVGRLLVPGLARPSDGTVSVAETRLGGACDHLVLPVSHTGMLVSSRVAAAVAEFLRSGAFAPAA
jgi:pimeloyl-ACP methyl ester carboxylesterase